MFNHPLTRVRSVAFLTAIAALLNASLAADAPNIPHLAKRGAATQLIVDGKPFLILGGELHNSSTSSIAYMKPNWPLLAQRNFNTLLASVTWEQIEPVEGQFDFTTLDGIIQDARKFNFHLVLLWFASWKNGQSSYMPLWVKRDPQRFPMARDKDGKELLVLSTLNQATADADAKAYAALLKHLKEFDTAHTVVMMQVENEVGVLGDSRDRSPAANKAFSGPVPAELMDYLQKHKDSLVPELADVWKANGSKTSGTWEQVFGPGKPDTIDIPVRTTTPPMDKTEHDTVAWRKLYWPVDEFFMAWNYARYVNKVTAAGKAQYPIPMYVNAWLQQPDHSWPGTYPCGGPVPQVINLWHAGAPAVDILAPDLYLTDFFDEVAGRFTRDGNPLFIPETSGDPANALKAFTKYNAIGFSPFGIDGRGFGGGGTANDPLSQTYNILAFVAPELLECQTKGTFAYLPPATAESPAVQQDVKLGNFTLTVRYSTIAGGGGGGAARGARGARGDPAGAAATPGAASQSAPTLFPGALILMPKPDEYIFVGTGLNVTFKPATGTAKLGYFEESLNVDGHWYPGRRLNGDETGNNTRWPGMGGGFNVYRVAVLPGD